MSDRFSGQIFHVKKGWHEISAPVAHSVQQIIGGHVTGVVCVQVNEKINPLLEGKQQASETQFATPLRDCDLVSGKGQCYTTAGASLGKVARWW